MMEATATESANKNTRKPTVRNRESVAFNSDLMTEDEAAEYLRISPGTLRNWRSGERYQVPVTFVGSTPMYLKSALDAWLDSRTVDKASMYETLPK